MKSKVFLGLVCCISQFCLANAATAAQSGKLTCSIWLKENASGYVYMVEGYLLGLYRYQSLVGNPSGSFAIISTKQLPGRVEEECKKNPQANVGEIATSIKQDLDRQYGIH